MINKLRQIKDNNQAISRARWLYEQGNKAVPFEAKQHKVHQECPGGFIPRRAGEKLIRDFSASDAAEGRARNLLLQWMIYTMPRIATKMNRTYKDQEGRVHQVNNFRVDHQVLDTIQSCRAAMDRADDLIEVFKLNDGYLKYDRETLALFIVAQEMGRMVVGSQLTAKNYGLEEEFLHPLVGGLILKEAFQPLEKIVEGRAADLLHDLVVATERHWQAIGYSPRLSYYLGLKHDWAIGEVTINPPKVFYENGEAKVEVFANGQKLKALASGISTVISLTDERIFRLYQRYACLAALAGLINQVTAATTADMRYHGFTDKQIILPTVEKRDVEGEELGMADENSRKERTYRNEAKQSRYWVDYIVNGQEKGEFELIDKNGTIISVSRGWRNQPATHDKASWLKALEEEAAIPFLEEEKNIAREAFRETAWKAGLSL